MIDYVLQKVIKIPGKESIIINKYIETRSLSWNIKVNKNTWGKVYHNERKYIDYVPPNFMKNTLERVYYNLQTYRNQIIDFALSKPLWNTWEGVARIYWNQVIGYVLPKSIKTPEKEFILMNKHGHVQKSCTQCWHLKKWQKLFYDISIRNMWFWNLKF